MTYPLIYENLHRQDGGKERLNSLLPLSKSVNGNERKSKTITDITTVTPQKKLVTAVK